MLVDGYTYKCENGLTVTVVRNKLPYYKFSALNKKAVNEQGNVVTCSETWTEEGKARHCDCGYNLLIEK